MSEDALCAAADAASQRGPAPAQDGPRPCAGPLPAQPVHGGAPTFEANLKAIHQFLASL